MGWAREDRTGADERTGRRRDGAQEIRLDAREKVTTCVTVTMTHVADGRDTATDVLSEHLQCRILTSAL